MKVIFLYPEYYEIARFGKKRKEYPPFGVLYLAAIAEQAGYSVSIQSVSNDNTRFDLQKYDVVLYSLSSSCTYSMMKKSREESMFSDKVRVVIGGIHASLYPKESFNEFRADYLIKGEGEIALLKILSNIQSGITDLQVQGVLTALNYSEDIEEAEYVKNLDDIPFPARHLLPEEDIIMTGRLSIRNLKMTHILVSRGCPYSCFFCGGINKNHRYRSASNVYEELVFLKDKYDIQGFVINDENFTINKKNVMSICEKIGQLGLPWSALSRVDTIDEEMLSAMANAHCIELKFGVESGSDTMLNLMNKRCSVQQATRALELCYKHGIKAKLFLIHGFPGENTFTTNETIDFLEQNKNRIDRISLFRWTPLPGSYSYEHADEFGLNKEKLMFNNAIIYSRDNEWYLDDDYNKMLSDEYARLKKYVDTNINNERKDNNSITY